MATEADKTESRKDENKDPPRKWWKPYAWALLGVLVLLVGYWNRNPSGTVKIVPDPEPPPPQGSSTGDPRGEPPAPPDMAAILGGLKVGSPTVNGWKVAALSISTKPEVQGALSVMLKNGTKSIVVWVAKKGSLRAPPQFDTEHYAIYSGMFVEADFVEVMIPIDDIVQRVKANEAQVNTGVAPPPKAPPPAVDTAPPRHE